MFALVTGPGSPHRPPPQIIDHVAEGTPLRDWTPKAPQPTAAKLTIVQVTDVYTLENFASLKTMLQETRNESGDGKVVSVLTGDFLAPYLLSTVDRGHGMMKALANTPIDYLTFGNHEADIDHKTVCKHVKNFPGTFINTNMQDHEAMEHQVPFEIIELKSPDSSQTRKVGLIAVLSDDPSLYQHFQAPGPFGGATIRSPWEVIKEYKEMLESPPYNCDLVIPLQHLYVSLTITLRVKTLIFRSFCRVMIITRWMKLWTVRDCLSLVLTPSLLLSWRCVGTEKTRANPIFRLALSRQAITHHVQYSRRKTAVPMMLSCHSARRN